VIAEGIIAAVRAESIVVAGERSLRLTACAGIALFGQDFEVGPSAANFLFVKPPAGRHGAAVADALRERRILVRRYDLDPIAGWLRITIGTRDQHDRLLEALKEM